MRIESRFGSNVTLRVKPLGKKHERASFTCGEPALDAWFHQRAQQDQKRRVSQVFVGLRGDRIVGFYSLSIFTLSLESLPAALAKKLPRYDSIPTALIGRLARATDEKGTGLGSLLLADAVARVLEVVETVATYAIVVDVKDPAARSFYEAHGFIGLPGHPQRLFLLTQTALAARLGNTSGHGA